MEFAISATKERVHTTLPAGTCRVQKSALMINAGFSVEYSAIGKNQ
jgi:hypothetical protein